MKPPPGNPGRFTSKISSAQDAEASWIVEGLYHLAFAVKKLADQANLNIFDFDSVVSLIPEAQERLAEFVKNRPNISTYRLFRNAATKQNIFENGSPERPTQLHLF